MGKNKQPRIRPLAICVFRQDDRIFVSEGHDRLKDQTFYRPLGGRIEFGERAAETVARELHEEIGAAVTDLHYLGTLENIFTYEGQPGHEIVLVYDGRFTEAERYAPEYTTTGYEEEVDEDFLALWKPLQFFREGHAPLYPDGLLPLLDGQPALP